MQQQTAKKQFILILVAGLFIAYNATVNTPLMASLQNTARLSSGVHDVGISIIPAGASALELPSPILLEKEFQAGDTITFLFDTRKNRNGEIRYHNFFLSDALFINGHQHSPCMWNGPVALLGNSNFGRVSIIGHTYIITTTSEVDFDLDIVMNFRPTSVQTRVNFNHNHCEIFPIPGTNNAIFFPATETAYPINIIPKENYRIKSVQIDTANHTAPSGGFDYVLVYDFEANAPESINGFTVNLWGHIEQGGILHPKNGYRINVITEYIGEVPLTKYKARLSSTVDSVFYTFMTHTGDDYSRDLYEIDFTPGDTIWVWNILSRNQNYEDRYRGLFGLNGVIINEYLQNSNNQALLGNPNFGTVVNVGRHRIITTSEVNFDLDIVLNVVPSSMEVNTRLHYNINHCEVFPAPVITSMLKTLKFPATETAYPINIIPKEGYRIKSVQIDTVNYWDDFDYVLVYDFEADDPESTIGFTFDLWGHFEHEGILYAKHSNFDTQMFGMRGFHINIITERIDGGIDPIVLGEIDLLLVEDVGTTNATVRARISSNGGASAEDIEIGFVYNISPNPMYDDVEVSKIIGTMFSPTSFMALVNTLTPDTEYFVKAYIKNSAGIAYSEEISFTTKTIDTSIVLGEVGWLTVYDIDTTNAGFTNELVSTGNAKEGDYELGFIYSTSPNPIYDDAEVSKVIGTMHNQVLFFTVVNDLTDNTEYFVKAYIKNPAGIAYSNEVSFTTDKKVSILEQIITNLLVAPNPTSAHTTVSVDLETAGNLTVTLNNMLGQELLEIYNGFTVEGTFTKTFSLKELPIGVYYLKIVHNGNVKVEKVIRQ